MAKKKTTQVDKQPKQAEHVHQDAAMDGTAEKIENLKSLNSMLLKETIEKRQQVDSLLSSKGSLESELTRSEMEKQDLLAELSRLRDCSAQVEFERHLVSLFLSVQVYEQGKVAEKKFGELVFEVGKGRNESKRLSQEKDALKSELEACIEESNGLSLKLVESEKREKELKKEVQKLNSAYNGVCKEKEEMDRSIESLAMENGLIKNELSDSLKKLEDQMRITDEIHGKKVESDEARARIEIDMAGLIREMSELKDTIWALEGKSKHLSSENEKLQKQMVKEVNDLVKEKEEKESSIQSLVVENGLIKKELSDSLKKLDDQMRKADEILGKKVEADEAKAIIETEMARLVKELSELRGDISVLEASSKHQSAENEKLKKQAVEFRETITQISNERDVARKGLDEGKKIVVSSQEKILELEKKLGDQVRKTDEILGKKVEVDEAKARIEIEMAGLVKQLSELRGDISALEATSKHQSAENEKLQKEVVELTETIGQIANERDGAQKGMDEGKKIVASSSEKILELEKSIEEKKREVEFLHHAVAESEKKKSFWTVVSSLTTIFAAASVAYAARGR